MSKWCLDLNPGKFRRPSQKKPIAFFRLLFTFATGATQSTATQLQLDQLLFVENFDRKPLTSTNVAASGGSNDEMHILVIDENGLFSGTPGEILEAHAFVSKANDAKKIEGGSNYVKDVLKNESQYIWLGTSSNLTSGNVTANQVHAGQPKASNTFRDFVVATDNTTAIVGGVLTGAADGFANADTPLTEANLTAGYNLYSDAETVDKKHSGKFISNLSNDVSMITNLVSTVILNLFKDSLTLIGLLTVMFLQNWKLSLIAIILIPILEIYLFIKIGSQIGAINTILLILITAIIGVYYAKYEGLNTIKSGFMQAVKNELPAYEIISGAAIAFAALLLIIPGFATDFLGFLLIFPITRKLIFGNLSKKLKKQKKEKNNFIDGEFEDIDENDDRKI